MSPFDIEESTKPRRVRIKLRMEYGTEVLVESLVVPVFVDEPWEDVVDYVFCNLKIEEVDEE